MKKTSMVALADTITVKDGGRWPINPVTGQPICDRCDGDAVRVSYSDPSEQGAVFFCASCDEHDPCDVDAPIVRRVGDPNAREALATATPLRSAIDCC